MFIYKFRFIHGALDNCFFASYVFTNVSLVEPDYCHWVSVFHLDCGFRSNAETLNDLINKKRMHLLVGCHSCSSQQHQRIAAYRPRFGQDPTLKCAVHIENAALLLVLPKADVWHRVPGM